MLQEGFNGAGGDRVQGLDEIVRKISERKSQLALNGSDSALRVAKEVQEIVEMEHSFLSSRKDDLSLMQAMQLELLPENLVERIGALLDYHFASREANERFERLLDELRHNLIQNQLDEFASQLANASAEEQAHLRDGLDALNQLIERRAGGADVDGDFESFMGRFGDLFPGNPKSLDELVSQLSYRMAAASKLMSAMSPDQRAKFDQLSESLLSDVDLAWQMDRLGANLRDAMPELEWEQSHRVGDRDSLSILGNTDAIDELVALEALERQLRAGGNPDALREVDLGSVEHLLGSDTAQSLKALSDLTKRLEEAGLVGRKEGRLFLTPDGIRRLGANALHELFTRLQRDRV